MPSYTEKLLKEIKTYESQSIKTIYFGGGTPTLLPVSLIEKILMNLKKHFDIEENAEITIEANPGTVDFEKLKELRRIGFNRISFGVQSFVPSEIKTLGRIHSSEEASLAILDAEKAGFENISADIMFGVPNQTLESLEESLYKMINLPLVHISAYSLSVDEGTPFYNMQLNLPSEDLEREMYYKIIDTLSKHGFNHYEISNFAKEGYESKHNTSYWTGEDYIGLGAGAHSYYKNERYQNVDNVEEYISFNNTTLNRVLIDEDEKNKEYYMLGLRLIKGIKNKGHKNMEKLISQGLVIIDGDMVRLTKRGIDMANHVFSELM